MEVFESHEHCSDVEAGVFGVQKANVSNDIEQFHAVYMLRKEIDVVAVFEAAAAVY